MKEGIKPETVIGVVGPTGSGKSALLNALLDEEQLVPTNCMRACTAVMTRIAFQDGDDPYRACIEFISSEEWEKDLRILMGDMKDDDEPSEECEDPETLAAIAYAKIKAVYPTKSKKDLVDGDVSSMLQDVFEFLGCTKEITETNSLRFSQRLGRYVDSKEETIENERDDQTSDETARELWPLIREVR